MWMVLVVKGELGADQDVDFCSQSSYFTVLAINVLLTSLDFIPLICEIRRTIVCQPQKITMKMELWGYKSRANGNLAHKSEAFLSDLHYPKE